jgi:DNA ligase-1
MATKLFDDWNVQLAKTYEPGMIKPGEWFSISQKINGARATYFAGEMVSRTGNRIEGLQDIIADLRKLQKYYGRTLVFDGELRLHETYCRGLTDNEAFKIGTGIANSTRDMSQKYKLQFIIFDVVASKDWQFDFCSNRYGDRFVELHTINKLIEDHNLTKLRVVPFMYSGTDQDMIEQCLLEANRNGWEGIMINRDERYQFKRTNAILKYKSFNTIDLECIGMLEGTGKYEGVMGALCCKFGENIVNVGTGFDDMTRKFIWDNGSWIKGKIIEVKYKDITSDAVTGLKSLQFPVFVQIKADKNVADNIEALRSSNIIDPSK